MGQSKETFLLYKNHIESILELDNFQAGIVFKNILRHVNGLELEFDNINSLEYGIFKGIKTQIDFSMKKYNEKCEKNKINANKRWNNANAYERMHNDIDIDSENENDIYNDNDVVDNLRQDIDLSTTTTTSPINKQDYLERGEFNNVVITQKQYQSCIKQVQNKLPNESKEVCVLFVNRIIEELDCNIGTGKAEKYSEHKPTEHAKILHQYINQKINKLNDTAYIKRYGNFIEQIKKEITQAEYIF